MGRLSGKVSIITGAGGGIGKAIAKTFAAEGSEVILVDLDKKSIQETAYELNSMGRNAITINHDVSLEEAWKDIISQVQQQKGLINILVNSAGIGQRQGIFETTLDQWTKVQYVNLQSVFLSMKYVVPELKKTEGGSVINVSSIYGIIGTGGGVAYHASKSGIRGLTKTAAVELGKYYIRVNSIHPGIIETPMIQDKLENKQIKANLHKSTPWPEFGKPDDVAQGALYLASDDSRFVTGSELVIDGGYTAQ